MFTLRHVYLETSLVVLFLCYPTRPWTKANLTL